MYRLVFFAALISIHSLVEAYEKKEPCLNENRQRRITFRHIESGGIGYENGYTTIEAFFASEPNRWCTTPFLDVRGHIFDDGKWAANGGVGFRAVWRDRTYGMNAYYDYRNSGRLRANQIGAGLETLGELFDFRINGYLPVGAKISKPYDPIFGNFIGHSMLVSQKYQSAMKGADAEFGFHFGKGELFDFYAAAGPYYFVGEIDPVIWGGKARISGTFKDILTLEISDSYDRTFHNKFQGQVSLTFALGPKTHGKEEGCISKSSYRLTDRMLQSVSRQEVIVIDKRRKKSVAIDPSTGLPYVFLFVNNTSSSNGTFESPYHNLAQAQESSATDNIIYVFPGDGTTKGMDSGISLKDGQKFWGSGIDHQIQTAQGTITIPAQTNLSPLLTNTNIDTDGNAITFANNNSISGFTIISPLNDAIFGINSQSLDISSCTFRNASTFAIQGTFSGNTTISITNNQFLNNENGISLNLNGPSTIACSNNLFEGQTSISEAPLEIASTENSLSLQIANNVFNSNITGSLRFDFTKVSSADISIQNNAFLNNQTGSKASLGSNIVLIENGLTDLCSISLTDNTFSGNTSNALYLHISGTFNTLGVIASSNKMTNNGGSGIVLATPVNSLTLVANNNSFSGLNNNGIAVISSGVTSKGNITIYNNQFSNIGNSSNAVAINQDFSDINLSIVKNKIEDCEGTGILSYSPDGINSWAMDISENTINYCQNLSSNAASGIDIEQYKNLKGSISNNTLLGNTGDSLFVGSSLSNPITCLTLSGNSNSTDYVLSNPAGGTFNLTPCNASSNNTGTINYSGDITSVESCPGAVPCPP